jgi:ergothioneine biosynthesis protein EgtB
MPTRRMGIDRAASLEWFRRNRRRSEEIFASVAPDAYYDRPIALRNPICFYEGHLPAFGVNTLLRRGLGEPGVDSRLETLFERGIDPEDESHVPGAAGNGWPAREEIRRYADAADRRIAQAIAQGDIARDANPVLAGGLALFTILEHEPMHQETLAYMWHRLPYDKKVRPPGAPALDVGGAPPARTSVRVPAGRATLGAAPGAIPFGWDNEFPARVEEVPAFEIDVHDVTNRDYLEFVEAGGYERRDLWTPEDWAWRLEQNVSCPAFWEQEGARWFWRGMWERVPLPEAWPVYVAHAEASAYARWRERRLPTEAEFQRAAYGTPEGHERRYPWGDEPPDDSRGNFDFRRSDPVPVGSFPRGASAWGVHDLVGNGWEWTSSVFAGFPGFEPMASYPVYSSDFFDGKHFVMKGASPVTARELLRPTFRNWFRGNYPYVYATFRCVKGSE